MQLSTRMLAISPQFSQQTCPHPCYPGSREIGPLSAHNQHAGAAQFCFPHREVPLARCSRLQTVGPIGCAIESHKHAIDHRGKGQVIVVSSNDQHNLHLPSRILIPNFHNDFIRTRFHDLHF